MTTEVSRHFDTAQQAVVVILRDDFGNQTPHTIYVVNPETRQAVDVNAAIASVKATIDTDITAAMAAMRAAGWQG